jgi:DNA-directed RNA polymerase specialized sigma24 family protein
LVERYVGEVLDEDHARDDVVQEVFMWLYSHDWNLILPRPGSFRRWLRSLSMKLALKDSEKRKNWQQTVDPIVLDELAEEYTPGIDEIDAEHRAWLVERAKSFIRKEFRPVGWEIFLRVYENHESVVDVGRDLGITRNVVHIYGCRIIARLKAVIRDFIDEL